MRYHGWDSIFMIIMIYRKTTGGYEIMKDTVLEVLGGLWGKKNNCVVSYFAESAFCQPKSCDKL